MVCLPIDTFHDTIIITSVEYGIDIHEINFTKGLSPKYIKLSCKIKTVSCVSNHEVSQSAVTLP